MAFMRRARLTHFRVASTVVIISALTESRHLENLGQELCLGVRYTVNAANNLKTTLIAEGGVFALVQHSAQLSTTTSRWPALAFHFLGKGDYL